MESRLVLAYGLIAAIVLGLVVAGLVYRDRRIKRMRRMRGIKSGEASRMSTSGGAARR